MRVIWSFLSGINSEFINQLYSDYLSDPKSLPTGWKIFFDGLSDDEKLVFNDLRGPTWSPEKKFKKLEGVLEDKKELLEEKINTGILQGTIFLKQRFPSTRR